MLFILCWLFLNHAAGYFLKVQMKKQHTSIICSFKIWKEKGRFDMPNVDLKIFIMKILECKNQMSSLTFKYAAKENDDFK